MHLRRTSSVLVATSALVLLAASPASAAAPVTPTGGGCAENGQAVAEFVRSAVPFGSTIVSGSVPISDDVATFFDMFC